MEIQRLFILFILGICVYSPCHAKKKRIEKYWKPSRIITSNSVSSSTLPASESLALQRVIKSENQRIEKDPYLLQAVFHSSKQVSKSALLALARIGDPYSVETLSRVLNGKDNELKQLAAFSMGQIGDELSVRLLSQHVAMERKPEIRGSFYRAMGLSRQLSALSILTRALDSESDPVVLRGVIEGFGVLISGNSASWIISEETLKRIVVLSQSHPSLNVPSGFALSQYKGDPQKIPSGQILSIFPKTPNTYAQTLLIRALSKVDDPQVTTFLLSKLSDGNPVPIKVEAMKSLKGRKLTELALTLFQKSLMGQSSQLVVACLETIDELPSHFGSLQDSVLKTFKDSNSVWVKSSALKTLCKLNPDLGHKQSLEILKSQDPILVSSALASLVLLNKSEDWPQIQALFKQGTPQIVSQSLEALANLKSDEITDEFRSVLKDLVPKKDPGLLALISQLASHKNWKDFAQPLADAYASLTSEDAVETKAAIIASLATIGSENQISVVNQALKDNSRQVVLAALDAAKTIGGKELPFQIPLNSKVTDSIPDFVVWKPATRQKVVLKTNRGEIELRFFDDTPITAYRFIDLIKNRFYNGKTFHRVVPNFVTQGGDPRGDGFGGAGFLLRDEFSPRNHERGTIGIATSGKDTGGCQFFFNLVPNYHLNGRYTVFAEVTSGMEVMDKLELGDKIISASLK